MLHDPGYYIYLSCVCVCVCVCMCVCILYRPVFHEPSLRESWDKFCKRSRSSIGTMSSKKSDGGTIPSKQSCASALDSALD